MPGREPSAVEYTTRGNGSDDSCVVNLVLRCTGLEVSNHPSANGSHHDYIAKLENEVKERDALVRQQQEDLDIASKRIQRQLAELAQLRAETLACKKCNEDSGPVVSTDDIDTCSEEKVDSPPTPRNESKQTNCSHGSSDEKSNHRVKPILDDDELLRLFMGRHEHLWIDRHELGFDPAEIAEEFNWTLVISLPNPAKQEKPSGITEHRAKDIFRNCFKGEETFAKDGTSKQPIRSMREEELFLKVFHSLPQGPHLLKGERLFGGRNDSQSAIDGPSCFLELILNVILTKIVFHCGLVLRCCFSEDDDHILVLVTSELHSLLREADRSGFTAELDVRVTDPRSLEPCTKTFYPLLHWYFRLKPVEQDDPLIKAYQNVLKMIEASPSDVQERYQAEIDFWKTMEINVDIISRGCQKKPERSNTADSNISAISFLQDTLPVNQEQPVLNHAPGTDKSHHSRNSTLSSMSEMHHMAEAYFHSKRFKIEQPGVFQGSVHLGSTYNQKVTYLKFLRYLELKAEKGLTAHPIDLLKQANSETHDLWSRMVCLKNFYDVLRLPVISPNRMFEIGSFQQRRVVWRHVEAATRSDGTNLLSPFTGQQRIKLMKSILDRQIDLDRLQHQGIVVGCCAFDTRDKVENLKTGEASELAVAWGIPDKAWGAFAKVVAFFRTVRRPPSIDAVRDYYGERVAFYFALLQFLYRALFFPSIVGLVCFIFQTYKPYESQKRDLRVALDLAYAVVIVAWGSIVLEFWKREQKLLSVRWGQDGVERRSGLRLAFWGIRRRSPVDYSDNDRFFPAGCFEFKVMGQLPRQICSGLVLLSIAAIEVVVTIFVGQFRHQWSKDLAWGAEIASIVTVMQMSFFSAIGKTLSIKLNQWENYRTNQAFLDALVTKMFLFEFVNRFMTFFYIAFAQSMFEGCMVWDHEQQEYFHQRPEQMGSDMCLDELRVQARTVLLMELGKNVVEVTIPLVMPTLQRLRERRLPTEHPTVDLSSGKAYMSHFATQVLGKSSYGNMEIDGTFYEYTEVMIFFGYVTLFSIMFPLTPAAVAGLLLFEIRIDGLKLFEIFQRPLPKNAESIGNWLWVLELMSFMSMLTNAALMVWTLRLFDGERILAFLVLVLLFAALQGLMKLLLPDVPKELYIIKDHHNFISSHIPSDKHKSLGSRNVDLTKVHLKVDQAASGQLRHPREFGRSEKSFRRHIAQMQALRKAMTGKALQGLSGFAAAHKVAYTISLE